VCDCVCRTMALRESTGNCVDVTFNMFRSPTLTLTTADSETLQATEAHRWMTGARCHNVWTSINHIYHRVLSHSINVDHIRLTTQSTTVTFYLHMNSTDTTNSLQTLQSASTSTLTVPTRPTVSKHYSQLLLPR